MRIHELLWPSDGVDRIHRHGVTPQEIEEACFGEALVLRAKAEGKHPVCYVLGQTPAGRYLFCAVIQFPDGKGTRSRRGPCGTQRGVATGNGGTDA